MRCLVCDTTENLLTETDRAEYRNRGLIGVDFYPEICRNCFEIKEDEE